MNNQILLMDKVFHKHENIPTFFIYVVDVLDIAGSLKKYVFDRLIDANVDFCVAVNKLDIVNEKYLNRHLLLQEVRGLMDEFVSGLEGSKKMEMRERVAKIKVILVSSLDRTGIKTLSTHLEKNLINRMQLVGFPNTGKTTLLNQLARTSKPTSKVPGTTLYITEHFHKRTIIYDMPGMHSEENLYNLISKPNLKSLLTWDKFYSPPILLHRALFFGGKAEIQDVKIILFGLGGACSSDNRWFVLNYRQFWKGLPPLHELEIQRYTIPLHFVDGKSEDVEIAGWGFLSFRLSVNDKTPRTK